MSCSVSTQLSLILLVLPVILRQGYFTIQLASMVSLFFSIAHFNRSIKWISSKLAFTVTFVNLWVLLHSLIFNFLVALYDVWRALGHLYISFAADRLRRFDHVRGHQDES